MNRCTTSLWRIVGSAALIALLLAAAACGSAGSINRVPPPDASDPARGAARQAFVTNLGLSMWIGIDDSETAAQVERNFQDGVQWWIGGEVVPDDTALHGFYFLPSTVFTAEVTIEANQTTIDQIRTDPAFYAPDGDGNLSAWVISGRILELAD